MKEFAFTDHVFPLGQKTYIMGILNVTPDSFSDGGKYDNVKAAVRYAEKMIEDGADIIDIGAVSTRPFADAVDEDEEWRRLQDVVGEIKRNTEIPVSVDTFNVSTAKKCLELGADIINDVSGVFSSEMAELVKKYNAGWVVMHGGVCVRKTEESIDFPFGVVNDVNSFFGKMINDIVSYGITSDRILLDAGFGFSKTNEQNIQLLQNYDKLVTGESGLLCGLSRKRFVGELSHDTDVSDRLAGTVAANTVAVSGGADIIRVHDVSFHKKYFTAADRFLRSRQDNI